MSNRHPIDDEIATIRARAKREMPEVNPADIPRLQRLADAHFPGLAEAINRGLAQAFTAKSLGVTPVQRDEVLKTADEVERFVIEGTKRASAAGADARLIEVIKGTALHRAERFRLDREVGIAFQRAAEEAAEVRL